MNDPFETGRSLPNGAGPLGVAEIPPFIDRYRIERVLGKGGFGLVYLAHDDQLQRLVAIKVPHPHRISATDDAEAYLTEARTVANLDRPHIVPVFEVGSTRDCPCFVVSKFKAVRPNDNPAGQVWQTERLEGPAGSVFPAGRIANPSRICEHEEAQACKAEV